MTVAHRVGAAICLLVGTTLVAWSSQPAGRDAVDVEIELRHTRFEPEVLRVPAGTTVRFTVHNRDPIAHELLIGDAPAQAAHELGTETSHGARPGEVSVPALSSATTSYRFDEPGVLLVGCHLPGHWDHGMRGRVIVVPAP